MKVPRRLLSIAAKTLWEAGLLGLFAAFATANALSQTTASPSPSPSPSASPEATPTATPSTSPSPQANFYNVGDDIFSNTGYGTLFYYFQGNRDGTAKVKQELRLGNTLWNDSAQFGIRIPYVTRFPLSGNPYYSLGNIEAGYSYNVPSKTFDHSLEARIALPTAQNGVESIDTQLKVFYTTKWKWPGFAIAYSNEYDQTVFQPKGASYTSYYEGKLTLPDYNFKNLPGLKFSAFYNYRVLFDSGGIWKGALGGTLFGNMNDLALSVTDSWGVGEHGLWKYKFEGNATFKLKD
jgi:hypothetical protein